VSSVFEQNYLEILHEACAQPGIVSAMNLASYRKNLGRIRVVTRPLRHSGLIPWAVLKDYVQLL
jgi:hypothetical protein